MRILIILCVLLADSASPAQSDAAAPLNRHPEETNSVSKQSGPSAQALATIRDQCIKSRRLICGRIEKVLPGGLIVDSGYTGLLRPPLNHSWLVPGTVAVKRTSNLVEGREPDAVCVGRVYLTDFPKSRLAKPRVFDYVVIEAFPAGRYTYASVGTVQHTVRHFTANLQTAFEFSLSAAGVLPLDAARAGR